MRVLGASWCLILALSTAVEAAPVVLVAPGGVFDVQLDNVSQGSQRGPFGSGGTCEVQTRARSAWPAGQQITLRREFRVPANVTRVEIKLALDNDAFVTLNGQDVGIGQIHRDGCPGPEGNVTLEGFSFVPGETNRLVVYGTNRGGESFLGVRVTGYTGSGVLED